MLGQATHLQMTCVFAIFYRGKGKKERSENNGGLFAKENEGLPTVF
jgi:hypothetical protein